MSGRYLVIAVPFLLLTAPFLSLVAASGPVPSDVGASPHLSYDRDGDHIDDTITPSSSFPIRTFVHIGPGHSVQVAGQRLDERGYSSGRPLGRLPVIPVQIPDMDAVKRASHFPFVSAIERDGEVWFTVDTSAKAAKVVPSGTYSPHTAHDLGYKGEGMTVAILDLGIDNEHPTLKGSFVAGADFSKPETPLQPRDGTYDPDDHGSHGTAVASVLAGRGDEGEFVGVAPRTGVIDLKMSDLNPAYQSNMAEAMEWCLDHKDTDWGNGHVGIDVISMSALTDTSPDSTLGQLQRMIAEAGIPFIQAAGNDGVKQGEQPATYWWSDNVIIAGGIEDMRTVDRTDDRYWDVATYGPRESDGDDDPYDELKPDVVAPASNLTVASGSADMSDASGWHVASGTSYATPHVSGIVTLMVQANPGLAQLGGTEVVETIRELLHDTAEARGEPYDPSLSNRYNSRYGYGIIDGYEAVKAALDMRTVNHPPQIQALEAEPSTTTYGSKVQVTVRASDPDGDQLSYFLDGGGGTVTGDGPSWEWTAPAEAGKYVLTVRVTDARGLSAWDKASVEVNDPGGEEPLEEENKDPSILVLRSSRTVLTVDETITIEVTASDPDGDELTYSWTVTGGQVQGSSAKVTYKAPSYPGDFKVTVTVSDGQGGEDSSSVRLRVEERIDEKVPPDVEMVRLEPDIVERGDDGEKVVLTAFIVEGSSDIDEVFADLSSIGDGMKPMRYSGKAQGQDDEDVYTLDIDLASDLRPGSYAITVGCRDVDGNEAREVTVTLTVLKDGSAGNWEDEKKIGDSVYMASALILALVIVAGTMTMGKRRKD